MDRPGAREFSELLAIFRRQNNTAHKRAQAQVEDSLGNVIIISCFSLFDLISNAARYSSVFLRTAFFRNHEILMSITSNDRYICTLFLWDVFFFQLLLFLFAVSAFAHINSAFYFSYSLSIVFLKTSSLCLALVVFFFETRLSFFFPLYLPVVMCELCKVSCVPARAFFFLFAPFSLY